MTRSSHPSSIGAFAALLLTVAACAGDSREVGSGMTGTSASGGSGSGSGDDGASADEGGEEASTGGTSATTGGTSATTGGTSATTGGTSATTGGTSATTGGTSATTGSSSDTGGVRLDVGADTTASSSSGGGEAGGAGCQKIDFLFLIDNSGSMCGHQQNLINNFGPFMDTIATMVDANDYHVMAVDSDECPTMSGTCMVTSCEQTLGAGQVRTCTVPDGKRYLTSSLDLATLKSTFSCVANAGCEGNANEMPMTAMVEAIGPLNETGQCNDGFLRDDAILVVTLISDDHSGWFGNDNENGYGGTPQSWYDAVIAKKGSPDNVVVLGLMALLSDQSCIGFGPEESDQFKAFVEMFGDHGIVASVCTPDYNSFFQQAVGLIDSTCDDFIPPG